jgi:phosphomannomutase
MTPIKFGTDGWRAIIADTYTVDNVRRVAEGIAAFLKSRNARSIVLGFDCRFGGPMFAQTVARVLAPQGITIYYSTNFVTTPMISLGVVKHGADLGVYITASHNPPEYNGLKLKSALGGPCIQADIQAVEALIPVKPELPFPVFESDMVQKMLVSTNLETFYLEQVYQHFDLNRIRESNIGIVFDAMYGAGQNLFRKILDKSVTLHGEHNPGFNGQAPEPIHKNLTELSAYLKTHRDAHIGIATDGDADRIGLYDDEGNFVDSHHILLMLVDYMHKKKAEGEVIITFSVTDKVKLLCEKLGIPYRVTPIGFKYIAEIMMESPVMVGGEESGGIAVAGHIPERDGIWIGLTLLDYMADSGLSLRSWIQQIYAVIGAFACDRDDLHLTQQKKESILTQCAAGSIRQIGKYSVTKTESIDGYKFYLGEDRWVMLRPSGTEPLLRVYSQAEDLHEAREILNETHQFFS